MMAGLDCFKLSRSLYRRPLSKNAFSFRDLDGWRSFLHAFFTIDPANNNRLVGLGYDLAGNGANDTITGSGARTCDAENRMTSAV